ncbi:MAG TPA: hypothetical protein VEK39_02105 [Solirubrobacterales bacterium]|nr:hypothetical protein [Solirubrobacterales bacterium]
MGAWRLTVRHGSQVERERYETLDDALAQLQRRAEQIRAGGGLEEAAMLRTYEPGEQVEARLELTGSGLVRRPEAGLDVMGDGALVPYRGAIFKRRLESRSANAYEAVRRTLER